MLLSLQISVIIYLSYASDVKMYKRKLDYFKKIKQQINSHGDWRNLVSLIF